MVSPRPASGFAAAKERRKARAKGKKEGRVALHVPRKGDDLFESAFRHAPVPSGLFGDDGAILKVNPALCRLLQYSEQELLALTFQEITYPDDLPTDLMWLARFNRNEIRTARWDKRYVRKDGQPVWVDLSVTLFEQEGIGRFTIGQIQDLTHRMAAQEALERSERQFRLIAQNTTDAIVTTDLDGRVTFLSASFERIVGAPGGDGAPYALASPADRRRLAAARRRLLQGQKVRPVRWRLTEPRTGRVAYLESQPSLVRDPLTDQPATFIDVIRDVTSQVEHEEAMDAARAEAVRLAGVKARFIANMSHEIRTPLTAIIGFTELSRRIQDLPPRAVANLERIHSAGEILIAIVNDILDFTKLEAGVVVIAPQPTNVVALVESVAQIFDPQAAAKGLRLERRFSALPASRLNVDPERLRQVLVNLVGNALKYTREGEVSVSLEHDAAAQRLRLSVRDTGPGIPPEEQERLFLRFSQIEAPSIREPGGVGLGLSICRGLVEAMGGQIELKSTLSQGSTFRLWLPAPPAEVPLEETAPEPLAPARDVRVLVVDDNPANRLLVRTALTSFGVEVVEACDGAEGVRAAAGAPVDLILMDIRMPVMSGRDALYRIRTEPGPNAETAIIAFTADTLFEPVLGCRDFDGVLHKPITLQGLMACLQAHLPAAEGQFPGA